MDDYIVIDVEPDGQEHQRALIIEALRIIKGKKVDSLSAFNGVERGKYNPPSFLFTQEIIRFIKDLPCLCYAESYTKAYIEYELEFFKLDGFVKYVGIEDIASQKFGCDISIEELVYKFDLSPKFDGYFYSHTDNIHSIYEILKTI